MENMEMIVEIFLSAGVMELMDREFFLVDILEDHSRYFSLERACIVKDTTWTFAST